MIGLKYMLHGLRPHDFPKFESYYDRIKITRLGHPWFPIVAFKSIYDRIKIP